MGDRGHIFVKDTGVYLYTHWGASYIPQMLKEALGKETRWNDPEYLTRIIADVVSENADETTGMGIDSNGHSDVWRVATVNCEEEKVVIADPEGTVEATFDEFVDDMGFSRVLAELDRLKG